MKFRLISDLHLDFSFYQVEPMEDDASTVLLIAGDICEANHKDLLTEFLVRCSDQFGAVVFILGNHDYYGANLFLHPQTIAEMDLPYNVVFLNNDVCRFEDEGIVIIGSTLWTNFDNEAMDLLFNAPKYLADYSYIRGVGRNITTNDIVEQFNVSRSFLWASILEYRKKGYKTIVMTHHAPLWESMSPGFEGDKLNGLFLNRMNQGILDYRPHIWCHGHVHSYHDYMFGYTRVLCNSRGYHSKIHSEKTDFNPTFTFEV